VHTYAHFIQHYCTVSIHQGEIVKKRVEECGLSIKEVARRIGMSRSAMYLIFDRREVHPRTILNIGMAINHDFSDDFKKLNSQLMVMEDTAEYGLSPEAIIKRLEKELSNCKAKCFDLMEENAQLLQGRLREYFNNKKPLNEMELHPNYTQLKLTPNKQ